MSAAAHGAAATDPVANESNCCFGCDYHNCLVTYCEHDSCFEMVGWNWDDDCWVHIGFDRPHGHQAQADKPEHLEWLREQRCNITPPETGSSLHQYDGYPGDREG